MAEASMLRKDDRVDLIHGEIITVSPIGKHHAAMVSRLNMLLVPQLASQAIVNVQNPIQISEESEADPDITIVPYRYDYYAESGVTPKDVLLLIEVSDSTLRYGRNAKLPLYVEAGIPEVWMVDVNKRRL